MARELRGRESSLLGAAEMLAALAEAAADLGALEAAGLAIMAHDQRTAYVVIPEHPGAAALIAALQSRGARLAPPEAMAPADAGPGVAAAAAVLLHAAAVSADGVDTALPVADEVLIVVTAAGDRLTATVAALAAAVPAARVGGFAGGDGDVVVFHGVDRPDAGSVLAAFRQGPFGDACRCLHLYAAGPALVALGDAAPPRAALRACGRILAAVMAPPDRDRRPALAVIADSPGAVTCHGLALPRHTGSGLQGRAPNLRVAARTLTAGDAVLEELRAAIAARGDGHAVRIDRLPAAARRRPAARIRDEIARLEAEWQIAVGLQAAQVRLLRFDHTQLPAMVDALRRLPQADMSRVGYAFAAAADYPIGCHFLKFSARDTAPLRPFIETVWRAACGGGPIAFWVDPGFARIHARGGVRSLVMVPEDHTLNPPFHAFQPGDIDRHLERTVALWAAPPGTAGDDGSDAAAALREPIYVFSPDPPGPRGAGTGKVRLEVLDGDGFAALTTGIGFINDCLVVADRIDVDDFIRTGAVAARRREVLTRLSEEEAARTRDLDGRAHDLETALTARLGDYLSWLTGEIETLSRFIAERGEEVERLAGASDAVLGRLAAACGEAASLKFSTGLMADGVVALDDDRHAIETGLARIIAATHDTIASGNARLEDARRRLAEVEARLARRR